VARIRVEWCERFARGAASASVASDVGLCAVRHAARNVIGRTRNTRNRSCAGTTSEMSKQAFAFGATSDPRLPPTSAARSAKIATLTGSNAASEAASQTPMGAANRIRSASAWIVSVVAWLRQQSESVRNRRAGGIAFLGSSGTRPHVSWVTILRQAVTDAL